MNASNLPRYSLRAGEIRAERGAGDTIPEPEMGLAIALACAISNAANERLGETLPAADRVTVRYGDDEVNELRETLAATRGQRRDVGTVPPSVLVRRSFGPPLPRTDEE